MTTIDWRALRPHVPLSPGAAEYVERTGSVGNEIAQWILAERSPLLVGGPAGVGKSTELARAAELLQSDRVACLVQLDRFENMRRLDANRMLLRIAHRVAYVAREQLHLQLSSSLEKELGNLADELKGVPAALRYATPPVLVQSVLTEVARVSRQHVALLIDGLEKVPPGPGGLELFDALAALPEEVELAAVIPWHAAFGPQAETVIRGGERFVAARAIDVQGDVGESGRKFLRRVLLQRLGWFDEALDPDSIGGDAPAEEWARQKATRERRLVDDAIRWSGGLPRTFLQLMADAGSYAKLRRPNEEAWPAAEDLRDAIADQIDSFRRLFLPGDIEAVRGAMGTSGSELDLDRKIRLMAHGILLERVRDGARVLDVHPLVEAMIDRTGAHA